MKYFAAAKYRDGAIEIVLCHTQCQASTAMERMKNTKDAVKAAAGWTDAQARKFSNDFLLDYTRKVMSKHWKEQQHV